MDSKTTVAERLKLAMTAAGYWGLRKGQQKPKTNALERASGVKASTISRLLSEPGKQPSAETLRKLSEALSVRYDWLAFGKGPLTDTSAIENGLDNPELVYAIVFNTGRFPREYLNDYARGHMKAASHLDREWFNQDIRASYATWKQTQPHNPDVDSDLDEEPPFNGRSE